MKPLLLKGHERPITMVKYNREGDLLFSTAKDQTPTLWYADNGQRVGTYNGHAGAVWACDVTWDSERFATCSADTTARLWQTETGDELMVFKQTGPVRMVDFSDGDKLLACVADQFMGHPATINIYDVSNGSASDNPVIQITETGHEGKITGAYWLPLNKGLLTTGQDGTIRVYDMKAGKFVNSAPVHTKTINSFQFNKEKTLAITGSADNMSKLLDVDTLEVIRTFETDRPVNAAAIHPTKDHVVIGGGQEAMSVTTTSTRVGKFEARFFHAVYGNEFGRVKGHFGPINSIAINPDGRSYASGAEDGYVRLHHFDNDYLEMDNDDGDDVDGEDEEQP